jgi:hypothetical protein
MSTETRPQVDRNLVAKAMQTHEGQQEFRVQVEENKKKQYKRKPKHPKQGWAEGGY